MELKIIFPILRGRRVICVLSETNEKIIDKLLRVLLFIERTKPIQKSGCREGCKAGLQFMANINKSKCLPNNMFRRQRKGER